MTWSRPRRRGTWIGLAAVVVVAVSVAFDVGGHTTTADRGRDLRADVTGINTDVASCDASLLDSFEAYSVVVRGDGAKRSTSEGIINGDEPDCTPASNSDLYDMATTEAPATLRAYDVQAVTDAVDTWAFPDAAKAITDLGTLLERPGDAVALADLRADVQKMRSLAASAERTLHVAASRLHTVVAPLDLGATGRLQAGGL